MAQTNADLIRVLSDLLGRLSCQYSEDITADYSKPTGFYLYVGVEGDVTFTDMRDVSSTRNFVAGYHPIRMKSITIASTTATDIAACFN